MNDPPKFSKQMPLPNGKLSMFQPYAYSFNKSHYGLLNISHPKVAPFQWNQQDPGDERTHSSSFESRAFLGLNVCCLGRAPWTQLLADQRQWISLTRGLIQQVTISIMWPLSMGKWLSDPDRGGSKPLKWLPEVDTFGGLRWVEVYWLIFMWRSLVNCCGPQPTLAKLTDGWSNVGGLVPKGLQMWA